MEKRVSSSPRSGDDGAGLALDVSAGAAAPVLRLARRRISGVGALTAVASVLIPLALWWGLAAIVMHLRHVAFPAPDS